MTSTRLTALTLIVMAAAVSACAAEAAKEVAEAKPNANGKRGTGADVGAADFMPSPEHPVGWRGDGTGRYPGATPPLEWYRRLKNDPGLACQAKKPSDAPKTLTRAIDIGLTDWLAVGPWVNDTQVAAKDEAALEPDEGDKLGDKVWKKLQMSEYACNLAAVFGLPPHHVKGEPIWNAKEKNIIYAHTYFYSESGGEIGMYLTCNWPAMLWLNGTCVNNRDKDYTDKPGLIRMTAKKGWNSFLLKSSGFNETWSFSAWVRQLPPAPWQYEDKNILWQVKLPGASVMAPIVVGDKIFVTGESWVAGLNKQDGKLLWGPTKVQDTIDAKREKMLKAAWQQGEPGWASTPCSDGKNVYVWTQQAFAGCFDLQGNKQWIKGVDFAGDTHHGFASSPTIAGGKFVTKQYQIFGFDLKTGDVAWQVPANFTYGSLVRATVGSEDVVIEQDGIFHTTADGSLFMNDKGSKDKTNNTCPSPIAIDGSLACFNIGTGLFLVDLAAMKAGKKDYTRIDFANAAMCGGCYADSAIASPIYHDGFVYLVTMGGTLVVFDVKAKKVAYWRQLDLRTCWDGRAGITASPSFAGKYLYVMDDSGNTVILQPGPEFKQVGKNVLHRAMTNGWDGHQNFPSMSPTNSTPVFDSNRIYWRVGDELYCIGEK